MDKYPDKNESYPSNKEMEKLVLELNGGIIHPKQYWTDSPGYLCPICEEEFIRWRHPSRQKTEYDHGSWICKK